MTPKTVRTASIALALLIAGLATSCGGSAKRATTTTTTSAPTSTPSTTAATATTTTTPAALETSTAVWPTAAGSQRFTGPVAAATSFATDYLKMVAPVVGAFRAGDSASGEVPIQATSRGPVTTVIVRSLGAEKSWWVLGSETPNIRLTEPATHATISSPVRLRGKSRAFEATVNLSLREDDNAKPLAEGFTMGGATELGPFDTSVAYARPKSHLGAIELYTISSESGHVLEATVIRVRLSGA